MEEQELDNSYKEIIQFYREHPVEFIEECFNVKLTNYQKTALTKAAAQPQAEYICWNRVNQKLHYTLFYIIRLLILSGEKKVET